MIRRILLLLQSLGLWTIITAKNKPPMQQPHQGRTKNSVFTRPCTQQFVSSWHEPGTHPASHDPDSAVHTNGRNTAVQKNKYASTLTCARLISRRCYMLWFVRHSIRFQQPLPSPALPGRPQQITLAQQSIESGSVLTQPLACHDSSACGNPEL